MSHLLTSPVTIPPLVGLTFSLLGGAFATCSKFLVFDFPRNWSALKYSRRYAGSVERINLDRDTDKLAIVSNVEIGHHDRLLFFYSIQNGKIPLTDDSRKSVVTHLVALSKEEGRLRSLGNVGLVPFDNCQRALLGSIELHRKCLIQLSKSGEAWDFGHESTAQEFDLGATLVDINEAIKVLKAQFAIARLA